jgi:hypothetical protein
MSIPAMRSEKALARGRLDDVIHRYFMAFVLGAWAVVTMAGYAMIVGFGGDPAMYVTTKPLNVNHRLVEGDIADAGLGYRFLDPGISTRADFIGRYAPAPMAAQRPIALDQTTLSPMLPQRRSAIGWFSLHALPPADVAALDARAVVELCNLGGDATCGSARIEAIVCVPPSGTTCSAAIRLSDAQRARFVRALSTDGGAKISLLTHGGGRLR